jgi:hypothetical protein
VWTSLIIIQDAIASTFLALEVPVSVVATIVAALNGLAAVDANFPALICWLEKIKNYAYTPTRSKKLGLVYTMHILVDLSPLLAYFSCDSMLISILVTLLCELSLVYCACPALL